jgi:hypothetical protein
MYRRTDKKKTEQQRIVMRLTTKYLSDYELITLIAHHHEHKEMSTTHTSGVEILLDLLKKVITKAPNDRDLTLVIYELQDLINGEEESKN